MSLDTFYWNDVDAAEEIDFDSVVEGSSASDLQSLMSSCPEPELDFVNRLFCGRRFLATTDCDANIYHVWLDTLDKFTSAEEAEFKRAENSRWRVGK